MGRDAYLNRKNEKKEKQGPLAALMSRIKNSGGKTDEELAAELSNDLAKNTQLICSKMKVIEPNPTIYTAEELQNIEDAIVYVVYKLENSPFICSDIREIDKRFLRIVDYFEEGVRTHSNNVIKNCISAFLKLVNDIRIDIPAAYQNNTKAYVNSMCDYLDKWLIVIQKANELDANQRKISEDRKAYEANKNATEEAKSKLKEEIRDNPEINQLTADILKLPRDQWNDKHVAHHKRTVDLTYKQDCEKTSFRILESRESGMMTQENQLNKLRLTVSGIPIILDPELDQKVAAQINELIEEMFAIDTKVAKYEDLIQEQDGMLNQLLDAPGHTKQYQKAQNVLRGIISELQNADKLVEDNTDAPAIKLLSSEELELKQRAIEEKKAIEAALRLEEAQKIKSEITNKQTITIGC